MRDEGRGKIKHGIIVHRPSSIVSRPMKGQSILEYSILLGAIVMVFFVMGPMIKRGTQSFIKAVADQVGTQQNAEQRFDERGHMERSYMASSGSMDKQTFDTAGTISYVFNDVTTTQTITVSNLGFTPGQ